MDYLFAYGTLKLGFVPPYLSEIAAKMDFIGEGFVHGTLYDLGEYSGAILEFATDKKIHGCVYNLCDESEILRVLDEYEGISPNQTEESLFIRKRTKIFLQNEEIIDGWIYEYNQSVDSASIIESGIWIP